MNIFNRVVTVLLLIVLLLVALVIAIFPLQSIDFTQRALEGISASFKTAESSYFWLYTGIRIAVVVVALIIFLLLLWGEVWPRRPRAAQVRTESGSQATVTTDSVARRLAWHIDQLADVISVQPQVMAHGKSVDVLINLQTSPEIDVPMKTDEVVGLAREVITERMGMQLGKIEVHIEHAPYKDEA